MIEQKLVEMLRCPETGKALQVVASSIVLKINESIARGDARDRQDQRVDAPIESALCVIGTTADDATYVYPIRDGIVCMVHDEAIRLPIVPPADRRTD